ncbi:MAG: anaerobic ribonucleoside-triphosphate reductase [Candidatus Hydrogenedentes bacterium]|nr:anaerobic ribonucleoside-triphosphate reductase [Candidatus Hydrogenedentota bacterium]
MRQHPDDDRAADDRDDSVRHAEARAGSLDAQLALSGALAGLPQPIATVVKRDGRIAAFDALKIAGAIERAGLETRELDRDTSFSLASAVALYLASTDENRESTSSEDVQRAVERVLHEMGYDRTAQCYLRHREGRRWAEGIHADAETPNTECSADLNIGEHLKISLHDADRIITDPANFDSALRSDPEGSSRLLAARVKEGFALSKVYSRAVSEAHTRADLFLHDLDAVDRLYSISPSLERLKRFGMETGEAQQRSFAAKEPDTLIAQVAGQSRALRPYFKGPITWEGLNFAFAPYVHQLDAGGLRDLAKVLLYEFAFRALSDGTANNESSFSLYWDVPQHMCGVELTGPGGALTERTCEDYLDTARDLARAVLEVYRKIAGEAVPLPAPSLVVHLAPHALERAEQALFLDSVSSIVSAGIPITIRCETDSPMLPHAGDLMSPVGVVAHRVTLNLPRAALRCRDEQGLFAELDRMVDLALQGHVQKRAFLERLVGKQRTGPLGLLASSRDGCPMVDLSKAGFVVGVIGLNECVHAITGAGLHESTMAADLGEAVIGHLRAQCEQWGEGLGMDVLLEPTFERSVGIRFASADSKLFGSRALEILNSTAKRGTDASEASHERRRVCPPLCYAAGAAAVDAARLTPMERIRLESRLYSHFNGRAYSRPPHPVGESTAESVAAFLKKAFIQTPCRGLVFE